MKYLTKTLFAAAILLISGSVFAAAELGKEYKVLNPALPTSSKSRQVGRKLECLPCS